MGLKRTLSTGQHVTKSTSCIKFCSGLGKEVIINSRHEKIFSFVGLVEQIFSYTEVKVAIPTHFTHLLMDPLPIPTSDCVGIVEKRNRLTNLLKKYRSL